MVGSASTNYVYGVGGEVLAEYNASGGLLNEYVYFGGRIARGDSFNNVTYTYADALGSSRIITYASGTPCYDSDFQPFGAEMNYGVNSCALNYKFTGQERDTETGNDHYWARYFGVTMSRWMTPDPVAGDITNPQSLNRYAYALNNPTTLTDPLGLISCDPAYGMDCCDPEDLFGCCPPGCDPSDIECEPTGAPPGPPPPGGGGTGGGGGGGGTGSTAPGAVWSSNGTWSEGHQPAVYPWSLWQVFGPVGSVYPCDFGVCAAVPIADQYTAQLGISGGWTIPLGINFSFFFGIAVDSHGHLAVYHGGGIGVGAGARGSVGVQVAGSNANTVCDLGGPFVNVSATGGAGATGSVDFFTGNGNGPGGQVIGGGGTVSIGGGADASAAITTTTVTPLGSARCH